MSSKLYQNSECLPGWLHDFEPVATFKNGQIEICLKCKMRKFFKDDNKTYLSYHIRQALQPGHNRFSKEYATTAE